MIDVSVPERRAPRPPHISVHRRRTIRPEDVTRHEGIPVTTPACTLIDIAPRVTRDELEAAVNDADKRDLVRPDRLRTLLDVSARRRGTGLLRDVLDRGSFRLTDSALERRFLRLVRAAGLSVPETGARVEGFKVDFYWPDLGLIVETDGLRYHRTPAQQARDRLRDQAHTAAGLTPLRFTYAQVKFEPERVRHTLAAVTAKLSAPSARGRGVS
jgi:very-short-patch-repair endonuclease